MDVDNKRRGRPSVRRRKVIELLTNNPSVSLQDAMLILDFGWSKRSYSKELSYCRNRLGISANIERRPTILDHSVLTNHLNEIESQNSNHLNEVEKEDQLKEKQNTKKMISSLIPRSGYALTLTACIDVTEYMLERFRDLLPKANIWLVLSRAGKWHAHGVISSEYSAEEIISAWASATSGYYIRSEYSDNKSVQVLYDFRNWYGYCIKQREKDFLFVARGDLACANPQMNIDSNAHNESECDMIICSNEGKAESSDNSDIIGDRSIEGEKADVENEGGFAARISVIENVESRNAPDSNGQPSDRFLSALQRLRAIAERRPIKADMEIVNMKDITRQMNKTLSQYERGYRDQPEQASARVNILGLRVGINQSLVTKRKYMKLIADFCDALKEKHEAFNISSQERAYFGKKQDLHKFIAMVKKMQQEQCDKDNKEV